MEEYDMPVRAIRGAITVERNDTQNILENTRILLQEIFERNNIDKNDLISILFTTTKDVNAVFPAAAAREMGLTDVPLMCAAEIDVPGSLKMCIRVMLHINTEKDLHEIHHVYLKEAKKLRPDIN